MWGGAGGKAGLAGVEADVAPARAGWKSLLSSNDILVSAAGGASFLRDTAITVAAAVDHDGQFLRTVALVGLAARRDFHQGIGSRSAAALIILGDAAGGAV